MNKSMLDKPIKNLSDYSTFRSASQEMLKNFDIYGSLEATAKGFGIPKKLENLSESYINNEVAEFSQREFPYYCEKKAERISRLIFLWSIPIAIISIILLWRFSEDTILNLELSVVIGVVEYGLLHLSDDGIPEIIVFFLKKIESKSYFNKYYDDNRAKWEEEYNADRDRKVENQKRAIEILENPDKDYSWLYDEWMQQVAKIRLDAVVYDVYEYVSANSDSKLVEIMLDKMPNELTTPRILMEKARIKAINDWVEIKVSMANINAMLNNMSRKK